MTESKKIIFTNQSNEIIVISPLFPVGWTLKIKKIPAKDVSRALSQTMEIFRAYNRLRLGMDSVPPRIIFPNLVCEITITSSVLRDGMTLQTTCSTKYLLSVIQQLEKSVKEFTKKEKNKPKSL